MKVSLSIQDTVKYLDDAIINGSITGERIDYYTLNAPNDGICVVAVYEKHYYRAGNRLTLTVTVDNLTGPSRVTYVAGGGGQGLFRFDWGAADSFSSVVYDTLHRFQI
jgi:hypothetical protein